MARAASAETLLILGDSLSAGYNMAASQAWPALVSEKWQQDPKKPQIINASISGDTAAQGLARLPGLLTQYHPKWVLIELGGNDGLRAFPPQQTEQNLRQIITTINSAKAIPLLMQIRLPANYGHRYNELFSRIYPALSQEFAIPLIPFFMEKVYLKPEWIQPDGIHPVVDAQHFIAEQMSMALIPRIKQP